MKSQQFVHLNVHSHYSLYNGVSTVKQLVDAAIKENMPGIAITDYGNMFGIMGFVDYVSSINEKRKKKRKKPFKPIIGCELYVAKHGSKEEKDWGRNLPYKKVNELLNEKVEVITYDMDKEPIERSFYPVEYGGNWITFLEDKFKEI